MSSNATRFESPLEAVPDALVGMDQKGVIRFVNRQTELLFGYDRDDLIGLPVETLVPEPLWQIYAQHKEGYFADPRTRSSGLDVELSGRHHNGGEFSIHVSMSHIDTGDVLLVITGVDDVAAQQRAVKNAQLTAAIVQYSDDAIIASTLQGVVTSWNPAAERMYGYSLEEMIGKYAGLLLPDERAGEMQANLGAVRGGQAVQRLETLRVRKDGTEVPVSITVAPIRDEDGVVVGASAVHRDVSEQRRAFEAAQRLARIVESSDDAMIGETLEGVITSWNPAAERMFGYSGAEIIGRSARLLVAEDQAGQFESVLGKVSAGQHVEHRETFNVRKDGTVFPISLTVSPIRDDDAVVGASVICRDVSERQKALEAAQRMVSIVEYSDDAIIGSTLDGIVTSWNTAAERLFGYSSQEMIGASVAAVSPKDRPSEIQTVLAKVRAGEHIHHLETIRVRKDGTVFPVSLTVSPICGADGAVVGTSMISRNMTALRHAAEYARSLIEVAQDPLMTISPEGTINDVNEATVKATGVPREALIGTDFSQYFTDPEAAHEVYQRAFTQGSVTDYPLTLRRQDGILIELLCNASVYRDISGVVLGVSAIGRDVTEQNQARAVVQRIAAIVKSSEDAIISGSLDGLITSWNPAAERMLGYSSAEIVGKPASFLTPKDRAGEIQAVLAKISAGQHVESLETKRVRKDGTVFPVSLSVSSIRDAGGAVVGTSVIYRDLTEQKGAL